MADILTLAEARAAVRLPASDTTHDTELTDVYIPAVTAVIEDVAGPIMTATGRTLAVDGGTSAITLPVKASAVTSVVESGVALSPSVDYAVDLTRGIIRRGSSVAGVSTVLGARFLRGFDNVVVTYNVGTAATAADVPANVKLAARIILRSLYQAEEQGQRPNLGTSNDDTVTSPSGWSLPKRAYQLLRATPRMPGFA